MAVIAILGAGFSGSILSVQLLRELRSQKIKRASVLLFDQSGEFGRGAAYRTSNPNHKLNVPAARMSAFPQEPEHFLNWLQKKSPGSTADTFAPRFFFGSYIGETLREETESLSSALEFEKISEQVTDVLERVSGKFQIHLQSGRTFEADSVVLALGNQTPANIPGTNEILNHPLYISNPWTANPITSSNSRILILGTGLTMIDTVLSLEAQNHNVSVLAVSRHGLLPSAHFNTQKPEKIPEFKNGDLKVLVQSVREGIKQLESQGGDWRWMIDSLRPALQNLWKSLSHGDKKQFLRHVRPYWEVCRHRIAPEIAEKIHGHIGAGRLEVRAARIVKIEVLKTKFLGTFKIRGSSQIEQRVFDCVINCAGPQTDFTQVRSQLVENLLKRKMIAVDSLKLGICADERNQVLDSKGDSQNGFFAIGSMLKGMLWETTAVPELRVQAEKLSKEICSFVFQERESPGEVAL